MLPTIAQSRAQSGERRPVLGFASFGLSLFAVSLVATALLDMAGPTTRVDVPRSRDDRRAAPVCIAQTNRTTEFRIRIPGAQQVKRAAGAGERTSRADPEVGAAHFP